MISDFSFNFRFCLNGGSTKAHFMTRNQSAILYNPIISLALYMLLKHGNKNATTILLSKRISIGIFLTLKSYNIIF